MNAIFWLTESSFERKKNPAKNFSEKFEQIKTSYDRLNISKHNKSSYKRQKQTKLIHNTRKTNLLAVQYKKKHIMLTLQKYDQANNFSNKLLPIVSRHL